VSNLAGARRTVLENRHSATRRLQLIQLGWPQFAVLGAGILAVTALALMFAPWRWPGFWVRYVLIPRIQATYGFECGDVSVRRFGNSTVWGISRVIPGGRLARLGLRDGDLPSLQDDGTGWVVMYDALARAERGQFGQFHVVNAFAEGTNDSDRRTIVTNPTDAQPATPREFGWFTRELSSPAGDRVLRTHVRIQDPGGELWVRDVATDRQAKLYAFEHGVGVVWSTDGRWVAISDLVANGARCVLLDAAGGPPRNLSVVIARHDEITRRHMQDNENVDCEVFGWIRGTSRVALTVSGFGRADPRGFRQDFFYDAASKTLLPVR
jgi:hypothetical protein